MLCVEQCFQVAYRHRVFFTQAVFGVENPLLHELLADGDAGRPRKVLVTLDEALAAARPELAPGIERYFASFGPGLILVRPPMLIEGGERAKNSYFHVSEIHSQVERYGVCRHSYLVAVGGGAHLDVAGLAAATAHRGLRHVRVPSTTLAQADSGVGVKNGVNAFGKKNFIGTFAPPFAVVNDFDLLGSLSPRDQRAGYVEAVKVALIRDRDFFEWIERSVTKLRAFEADAVRTLIHRCAELHVRHIATGGDPFESGSARPLDFGHWAAHKLEQLSEYRLRHGEAVAIGIALDVIYARMRGLLKAAGAARVIDLLEALGFELFAHELGHRDPEGCRLVVRGLEEFREHLGGRLTVTLLAELGRGVEVHEMDASLVEQAIQELEHRAQARASQQA